MPNTQDIRLSRDRLEAVYGHLPAHFADILRDDARKESARARALSEANKHTAALHAADRACEYGTAAALIAQKDGGAYI